MLTGLHYFGAFLLLAATALLIVTTITAPVIDNLALLNVRLGDGARGSSIHYGTFGWCVMDANLDGSNECTRSMLGYTPSDALGIDTRWFSDAGEKSMRIMTRIMILHPIASGLCFFGSALAFGSSLFGSFLSSMVGLLAFLVTLVAVVCDFILFAIIRRDVNKSDSDADASFAAGLWTLLAASASALVGSIILFLTCCFGRSRRRRESKIRLDTVDRPWYRRW